MTELSAESTLGRYGDVEFPLVVPTLTRDELSTLVQSQDGQAIPQSIRDKAAAHATQRLGAGLSPYADPTEARTDVYPDLMRARLVGPQAASWNRLRAK
jgi:GGDEF domain-containing protein